MSDRIFDHAALAPMAFVILVLALAGPSRAQIPFDPSRNQGIGGVAGLASGSGVSYQEILPSAFGYRGTLFGWKLGGSSFVDLGAAGLRVLSDDGRRRLYLIGGVSYWRWSDEETVTEFDQNGNVIGESEVDDVDESWSIGVGAGIELPFTTRTTVSFEGLFTYWDKSSDFLPLPQIAVHYLF
jgi:hypothetical protein